MKKIEHILNDGYSFWNLSQVWLYIYNGKLYKMEFSKGVTLHHCLYECDLSRFALEQETIELKSTAYALQGTIATWYVALRTIALVGLLSVLVYIGIRIILTSTSAQDKAKYKNMLKDWVVAICILFLLHYIMAFTVGFTNTVNNIMKGNVIEKTTEENNSDKLMNEIRKEIGEELDNASIGDAAGYTIMYFVLVILTGTFTFQYLKRVIYIAFLTMIAPMIALTYPLDKVKDGKAQAFSFWLKEYILNCLIQPIHLMLYAVLIANAMNMAETNMLYAIVALTFMMPAEKIIKQMFGIKSESSYNTLSAAAGGAMVMNMVNKLKGVASKGDKGSRGGASGGGSGQASNANVRTATRNGGDGSTDGSSVPTGLSSPGGGTSTLGGSGGGSSGGSGGAGRGSSGSSGGTSRGSSGSSKTGNFKRRNKRNG